ncbi:MAG: tetratricopeptide repeat protein [Rikenellaceae bacterium]|jgi:tetratricopeptide (TPR) repeat protein|nr:tetratricopeptide repeat protein [Rikenellaceae bacterium]
MKKSILLLLPSLFACAAFGQQERVDEGILYHDAGDYDRAISFYKQALKIDPESGRPITNWRSHFPPKGNGARPSASATR